MKIGNANPVIAGLREQIEHLEGTVAKRKAVLPFGVDEIDDCLPGGGLSYGAIHEFAGGGTGTVDGAAAALFAAGIAARTKGKIVWCLTRPDLFFPALAQAGLHHNRVVFVEADKEEDVLASLEEGLSFGGLGAVVGELVRLPMTASRRLQLAAERTGTLGIIVRRWRRQTEASDFGQPTASTTRWRDIVGLAVTEAKGIIKVSSIPALVKKMKSCLNTMKTVSQFQRCNTFGSVLIFYRKQESGPASMDEVLKAVTVASTRVFGKAGGDMSLQWVGTIGGITTRELRGFPRTY